jgi:membrane-bound ClpP family serine protease
VIWSVAITFAGLLLGVGYLLLRAKRQGPTSGVEAMADEVGVLTVPVSSVRSGRVFLRGAYWTAVSDQAMELAEGAKVRVVRMEGTRAVVAPIREEPDTSGSDPTGKGA